MIAHDRPGEFTAVHNAYPGGAAFGLATIYGPQAGGEGLVAAFFHVKVTFRPISATRTQCIARLVAYFSMKKNSQGKPVLIGPSNVDSPETAKFVQDLLANAEKRMMHQHPEFRPQ